MGAAVLFCYHIYSHFTQIDEQTEAFEQIAEVVARVQQQVQQEEPPLSDTAPVCEEEDVLSEYKDLYLQIEDTLGWIAIADTEINYLIMQTKSNPNFYLNHNLNKAHSDLGVPYMQENCNLATSDNLIIYGHHIKGSRMFGALFIIVSSLFWEKHI